MKIFGITTLLAISLANFNISSATNQPHLMFTEIGNHEISELEWVEFQNTGTDNFELTGLIFREQSVNHKTTLMQGSNILAPNQFALIVNNYEKFILKYPSLLNSQKTILDSSWTILSDQGEQLELIKNGQNIETIIYPENKSTFALERIKKDNLYTNQWTPHPNSNSMLAENYTNILTANLETDQPIIEEGNPETTTEESNTEQNNPDNEPIQSDITPIEEDEDPTNSTETDENEPNIEATIVENIPDQNNQSNNDEDQDTPTLEPNIIYQEVITYIERPFIIISEVSFNSSPDWIEIFIDPRENEINLNNLQVEIDKKFLNLGLTGKINQPSIITAELDLVATTEQVSILYNSKIYDSVCWRNESPTSTELLEEEILIQNQYWQGPCLTSTEIKKDETFSRQSLIPDNNQSLDFKKTNQPTKGQFKQVANQAPKAEITIQTGKPTGQAPLTINLDGTKSVDPENQTLEFEWDFAGTKITKANPDSFKFDNTGEHLVTLTVTDPEGASSKSSLMVIATAKESTSNNSTTTTASSRSNNNVASKSSNLSATLESDQKNTTEAPNLNIQLSSFMPNPKGVDTEAEWIEIVNNDIKTIQLDNYYIDDEQGGSKPFKLENISIKPFEKLKFYSSQTKISLGNTKDTVRLLFKDQVLEEASYENAKDDDIFKKVNGQWYHTNLKDETPLEEEKSSPAPISAKSTIINPETTTAAKMWELSAMELGTPNNVSITEIFPNPKGEDKNKEWIEIYNWGYETADIEGMTVKIGNKSIPLDAKNIPARSFYIFKSDKLSLPNNGGEVALMAKNKINMRDMFKYDKSIEDHSVFKFEQGLMWTKFISPGKPNPEKLIIKGNITEIDKTQQIITVNADQTKNYKIFTPENILKKLEVNDKVELFIWVDYKNELLLDHIVDLQKDNSTETKKSKILWTILIPFILIPAIIYREKIKEIFIYLSNQ